MRVLGARTRSSARGRLISGGAPRVMRADERSRGAFLPDEHLGRSARRFASLRAGETTRGAATFAAENRSPNNAGAQTVARHAARPGRLRRLDARAAV